MNKYEVGDVLRIRAWDDMAEEFGGDGYEIPCKFSFTRSMEHLCGQEFVVREIDTEGYYHSESGVEDGWNISSDMLEYAEELIDDDEFETIISG